MDSQVLRPIMTALVRVEADAPSGLEVLLSIGGVDVTRLKCAMSPGRRHAFEAEN